MDFSNNDITSAGAAELSIMLHSNTPIRSLNLGSNSLGDEGFEALCDSQGFYQLEFLDVSNNGITGKAIEYWLQNSTHRKFFDRNPSLETQITYINFQQNILKDECFSLWSTVALDNLRLKIQHLNLRGCEIGDEGAQYIAEFIKNSSETFGSLRDIDLGANKISAIGAYHLANSLDGNSCIYKFNIRANQIGDDGAKAFAHVFKKNNNEVRELYLGHNAIRLEGIVELSYLLQYNTKLEKFDIQGVKLDLHSTQIVAAALRNNKDLIQLNIDIDSTSNEAARLLADALKSNNTLQDLIIGGELNVDEGITNSISNQLSLNKYLAENPDKKLETMREKIREDQNQINNLQDQVNDIQQKLEEEKQRSQELEKLIEISKNNIKEKERQIEESDQLMESLKAEIEQKNLTESTEIIEEFEKKLQEATEKSKQLDNQYQNVTAKLKEDENLLEQQNYKIQELQKSLENQSAEAQEKINQAELRSKQLEEQLIAVQKQLQNTSKILEDERAKAQESNQLESENRNNIQDELKQELEELKSQLQSEREIKQEIESKFQKEKEELEKKLINERQNFEKQKEEEELLKDELLKQKEELNNNKLELEKHKKELEMNLEEMNLKQNELDKKNNEIEKQKQELTKHKDDLTKHRDDLTKQKDELEKHKDEITKQKEEMKKLENEKEELEKQVFDNAASVNPELEGQLESVKLEVFNLRDELNSQKDLVSSLKDQQSEQIINLLDDLHPKIESAVRLLFQQFWPDILKAIQDHHDKEIEILRTEQKKDFENISRELRKLELNIQEIGDETSGGGRDVSNRVDQVVSQVTDTISIMNEKFRDVENQLQESLLASALKQPNVGAIEDRLKKFVKSLVGDIQEDIDVIRAYSRQSAQNSFDSSQNRENIANVKKDLNSVLLDSESKIINKITDIDYKYTQLLHDLERNFDQKYDTQQRMIISLQSRERSLEEEGIRTKLSQGQISDQVGLEIQRRTRDIEKRMQAEIDDLSTSYKTHISILEKQNLDNERRISSYESIISSLNLRLSELENRASSDLIPKESHRESQRDSLWRSSQGFSSAPIKESTVGYSPIPQKRSDHHRLSVSRRVIPSSPFNDRTDDVQKRVSRLAKRVEGLEEFFNQDKPESSFFSLDDLNH